MKNGLFIYLWLATGVLVSCNRQPQTPCDCWNRSSTLFKELDKKDSLLNRYDFDRKRNYKKDIDNIIKEAENLDQLVGYCREIYKNKGFCKDESMKLASLWDYGNLIDPENADMYRRKYSGNWERDSVLFCNNRFISPPKSREAYLSGLHQKVYFQLWYKLTVEETLLTEMEQHFYDSMANLMHIQGVNPQGPLDSTWFTGPYYSTNDSSYFPRVGNDKKNGK